MKTAYVTIPATSANLGAGFDTIGIALGLYNEVRFTEQTSGLKITISGEGQAELPQNDQNLVYRAANLLFDLVGKRPAGLHIHQHNEVPCSSGMGSSASAIVGGLLAANALVDGGLSQTELLQLAIEIEGHPDNVSPALLGGLALCIRLDDESYHIEHFPLPALQATMVLPQFELSTATARAALPAMLPRADVVYNLGRFPLLIHALKTGNYDKLGIAMTDRIHQPYRIPLVPGMAEALQAGREAGATGVAISGAGPSLIAFSPNNHHAIGTAMSEAFGAVGLRSRIWTLPLDANGAVTAVESL